MTNLTQTQLTEIAEQKPDELVRMIAEVCYGWQQMSFRGTGYYWRDDTPVIPFQNFNPLAKTERGRSQAFELAEKFDCFPVLHKDLWVVLFGREDSPILVEHKDPQTALAIASILAAQELKR